MKNLLLLSLVLLYSVLMIGCGSAGGSGGATAGSPTGPTDPSAVLPVVDPTSPSNIVLTYYKLSKTDAPVNGWPTKTYTATGKCVQYLGNTFCWDDGMKTIQFTFNNQQYGPYTYTYWGLGRNPNGTWASCSGACYQDLLSSPTYTSPTLIANVTAAKITAILTTGAPTVVNCAEGNGKLNCIDFVIDLNQSPL